jgi:hypothetical protein
MATLELLEVPVTSTLDATTDAWLADLDKNLLPPPVGATLDAFGEARRARAIDESLVKHPAEELPLDGLTFVLA